MPYGSWINDLPTAFFMVVHIAAFALGAGFAWLAFKRELSLLGTAFSLFAAAELTYMTYHLDWTVFLFAHTIAEVRSEPRDWWALAWLRGTEIATDALWSRSSSFNARGRRGMWFAGASNATMALGYGWLASRRGARRRSALSLVPGLRRR